MQIFCTTFNQTFRQGLILCLLFIQAVFPPEYHTDWSKSAKNIIYYLKEEQKLQGPESKRNA
jgi:hypothetical protein